MQLLGTNNTSPATTKRAVKSTTKKLKTKEGDTWRKLLGAIGIMIHEPWGPSFLPNEIA